VCGPAAPAVVLIIWNGPALRQSEAGQIGYRYSTCDKNRPR